jgi:hypothetical protein
MCTVRYALLIEDPQGLVGLEGRNLNMLMYDYDVFTAVAMKNAVFWDIKTQFVPHRKHHVCATEPSRLLLCKI